MNEKINKLESIWIKVASDVLLHDDDLKIEFWIITITQAILSKDKSYLDFYVSSFNNKELLTKWLAKRAYLIKSWISNRISIRKVPQIRFKYDESWEISQNIIEKINKLDC